ncbi:hypothetical protein TrVFT333_009050 [Trichoderma virens FT-333]|nr:hypothetical protein TrVFT333_009050 [Trichoderma virens FT-333]
MVRLHTRLSPPVTTTLSPAARTRIIQFRHPAYSASYNPLLRLQAADSDPEGRPGIDYDTAFIACSIVTGNKWHGWLAIKDSGGNFLGLERPDDGILTSELYYFCLDRQNPARAYPAIPSFDHWRFPHNDIPEPWAGLVIPNSRHELDVTFRDSTCRITGYVNATEAAHLVPASAVGWFNSNSMSRYCSNQLDAFEINDGRNMILLRRDLHYLFDQRRLAFVVNQSGDQNAQLVTHSLIPPGEIGATELAHLYHNRRLQPLSGISLEFLLARFAWSIFTDALYPFLKNHGMFTVQIYDPEVDQYAIKDLRSLQIKGLSLIFSRDISSRRRQHSEDEPEEYDVEEEEEEESEEEWPGRGRRRRRSGDYSVPGLQFDLSPSPAETQNRVNLEGSVDDADESCRKRPRVEPFPRDQADQL